MNTVYFDLKALGVPMEHHESDLYVPVTAETAEAVNRWEHRGNVTTFLHQVHKTLWYDIPFCFEPYWEARRPKAQRTEVTA